MNTMGQWPSKDCWNDFTNDDLLAIIKAADIAPSDNIQVRTAIKALRLLIERLEKGEVTDRRILSGTLAEFGISPHHGNAR